MHWSWYVSISMKTSFHVELHFEIHKILQIQQSKHQTWHWAALEHDVVNLWWLQQLECSHFPKAIAWINLGSVENQQQKIPGICGSWSLSSEISVNDEPCHDLSGSLRPATLDQSQLGATAGLLWFFRIFRGWTAAGSLKRFWTAQQPYTGSSVRLVHFTQYFSPAPRPTKIPSLLLSHVDRQKFRPFSFFQRQLFQHCE